MLKADPLAQFRGWLVEALAESSLMHPRSFCLSTTDEHGAPDARFVDLKDVTADGLIFGTHLKSAKASAIARDPRVAATFWWDHIARQVRITGLCSQISGAASDVLFRQRPRVARLVSRISTQSKPVNDPADLERLLEVEIAETGDRDIDRPAEWGGYCIEPVRLEFLMFQPSRLHQRQVYTRDGDRWRMEWLQP